MRNCPNCGNHWDIEDPENLIAAEAGRRSPIIMVEFIRSEMDETIKKMRCTACSEVWTGRYRDETLVEVERYHKGKHRFTSENPTLD